MEDHQITRFHRYTLNDLDLEMICQYVQDHQYPLHPKSTVETSVDLHARKTDLLRNGIGFCRTKSNCSRYWWCKICWSGRRWIFHVPTYQRTAIDWESHRNHSIYLDCPASDHHCFRRLSWLIDPKMPEREREKKTDPMLAAGKTRRFYSFKIWWMTNKICCIGIKDIRTKAWFSTIFVDIWTWAL